DPGRDDPPGPPPGPDRTPPTEPHPWGQAPRTRGKLPEPPPVGGVLPPTVPYQDPSAYGYTYKRPSQATTALVFAILGLFCCGLPSVIGTVMAKADLRAIARGRTDPANHGTAQVAFIVGLAASVLWLGVMALWFLAALASIAASSVP
ncbi:MAG: DUF4190 domain-containing protein, partial [Acidimicrobiia bacterium]|nr:DUF4190 domain-containing protein [Acidimicrobiia bacterium]